MSLASTSSTTHAALALLTADHKKVRASDLDNGALGMELFDRNTELMAARGVDDETDDELEQPPAAKRAGARKTSTGVQRSR